MSHQQGDYAAARTYIPAYNVSRLQNQSSFNTGGTRSPASSEAHEELASVPSRSASQYDDSTVRSHGGPDTSSRKTHLSHARRALSHKDSFGGSHGHGFGIGADLSGDSADEASTSAFASYTQRFASPKIDNRSNDGHHRTGSPLPPSRYAHASTHKAASANATDNEAKEPVEVIGRASAFTDLASSRSQKFNSSSSHPASAPTAVSRTADPETTADAADTTFAARFDQALAFNPQPSQSSSGARSTSTHQIRVPAADDTYLSSTERDTLDLPEPGDTRSSPGKGTSNSAADESITPSASARDIKSSEAEPKPASQRQIPAPSQPQTPQHKDRRDRSESTKAVPSSARPSSSRPRDATASSSRADAGNSSGRTLKTSHRTLPQLPSAQSVKPAPPPAMYWSKAPTHGSVPRRSFRAHTANLCDEVMWLFGGCDHRGCFRDLWCFDTETMCWSKPKVTGDVPPARRAHTATMVNKRLFVFAGGDGPHYFNDLYIFDTISLRWTKPEVGGKAPSPRRAHTCNYYEGQLIVFGGGNGVGALNDVHVLDVTDLSRLEWRKMECGGKVPIGRGYHTSNLVDGKLIVIGGSDGHMSFNDIHILRLDTKMWYQVKTDETHNRLGHTATQVGSYLFIFGGHDSKTYTSELLTLNLVNLQWEPRKVCGKKPAGRGYHQAWLRDSRLFVHGGFDGKDIFDDLHYLDLAACAYLPQITSFSVELDDEE